MFTTLYLIPTMIPLSINVIIWKWIFNPNYGLANAIVTFFGGEPQTWYSDPTLTKLWHHPAGYFGRRIFCIDVPVRHHGSGPGHLRGCGY